MVVSYLPAEYTSSRPQSLPSGGPIWLLQWFLVSKALLSNIFSDLEHGSMHPYLRLGFHGPASEEGPE